MTITAIKFSNPVIKGVALEKRNKLEVMLLETLDYFPELGCDVIHLGLTRAFGIAAFALTQDKERIKIRYNPASKLSYNLLGHELTHFVQRLGDIPHGEVQCDIWALARDELFTDAAPEYLLLPNAVKQDWSKYSDVVRSLCIDSIRERAQGRRRYIVWLNKELRELIP